MVDDLPREFLVEILLVEDNPADVEMMRQSLRESKIANNMHVVHDGEAALDFLHQRGTFAPAPRPELILLDLRIPKKSGFEVLEEIKNDPNLRQIPVIVLTSSKADEDIFKSYDLHSNCFITKPVHLKDLFDVIKNIEDFWFGIVKLPPR